VPQDSIYFPEHGFLMQGKINDAVRYHDIKGLIFVGDFFRIDFPDLKVRYTPKSEILFSPRNHVFRQIYSADAPLFAD